MFNSNPNFSIEGWVDGERGWALHDAALLGGRSDGADARSVPGDPRVPRRRQKPPEPAWHRRERQKRSNARAMLRVVGVEHIELALGRLVPPSLALEAAARHLVVLEAIHAVMA